MTSPGWSMRPRPAHPFISRILLVGGAVFLALAIASRLAGAETTTYSLRCSHMQRLAQEHSNDMAARRSLDHRGFDHRAARGARAENVALASSREQAMRLWRASPGHAANMRLPGCVGVANRGRYWTMEIGIR